MSAELSEETERTAETSQGHFIHPIHLILHEEILQNRNNGATI